MAVPVKLPKDVLDLFPQWEYCCPCCGAYVESDVLVCPKCKTPFDEVKWRVPPRFLESKDAMSEYAHKVLAPKLTPKQRKMLFLYFTEFFTDGFENGDFTAWSGTVGSPSVQSSVKHCGSYALAASGTENVYAYKDFTPQSTLFVRFYVQWSGLSDSSSTRPIRILGNSNLVTTILVESDRMSYYRSSWHDGAMDVYPDTWYCVEFEFVKHVTEGIMRLYVDGDELVGETGLNTSGFSDPDQIKVGLTDYGTYNTTVYIDCVVVADTYVGQETETQTTTKTWASDSLFKKLGLTETFEADTVLQKQDIAEAFMIDAALVKRDEMKSFALDVHFFGTLIGHTVGKQFDVVLKKLGVSETFGLDVCFGVVEETSYTVSFGLNSLFAYKVRLPELWLDQNGNLVLNISKPYAWVGL